MALKSATQAEEKKGAGPSGGETDPHEEVISLDSKDRSRGYMTVD